MESWPRCPTVRENRSRTARPVVATTAGLSLRRIGIRIRPAWLAALWFVDWHLTRDQGRLKRGEGRRRSAPFPLKFALPLRFGDLVVVEARRHGTRNCQPRFRVVLLQLRARDLAAGGGNVPSRVRARAAGGGVSGLFLFHFAVPVEPHRGKPPQNCQSGRAKWRLCSGNTDKGTRRSLRLSLRSRWY